LMAQPAAHLEMPVTFQKRRIDDIAPVQFFHLNWRRRSRSPFARSRLNRNRSMQGFHQGIIRVTFDATAFIGSRGRKRPEDKKGKKTRGKKNILFHVAPLCI